MKNLFPLVVTLLLFVSSIVNGQDNNVYTSVDKLPRLKGAGNNIGQYLQKQIDYNDAYKLQGIEGEVWVSFIVRANGEITDVELEKGIDENLDAEVIEAVKATNKWKPGKINRNDVDTQMRIPIRFALSNSERHYAAQLKSFEQNGLKPLFVLDNKLIEGVVKIEDYNIESIRVIKGEKAIKLYGQRAENGVVVMTSKNGTPPLY